MKKGLGLLLLVFYGSSLFGALSSNESEFARKITSCLLIKDYERAISTCEVALKIFPDSEELMSLLIRLLSESGDSQKAIKIFNSTLKERDLKDIFSVVESISWGVLECSPEKTEMTKLTSMFGAHLTQDVRAINILLGAMRSSSTLLRSFSLRLAGQYHDKILQKEVLRLFQEEKNPFVREQVIETIGTMRIKEAEAPLRALIESQGVTHEEIASAIKALVRILDDVSDDALALLLSHKRAGVRQLGVALIDHFSKRERLQLLFPLLADPSPTVRLHAMAILSIEQLPLDVLEKIKPQINKMSKSANGDLATLSSWLSLQYDQEGALRKLKKWVLSEDQKAASRAAALLGAGGDRTKSLILEAFEEVIHPFVKANLALSMLKQNIAPEKGIAYLHQFLMNTKEKLMWEKRLYPMFTTLIPSVAKHIAHVPRYPELLDQTTRLNLINILSIVGDKKTKELIQVFLQSQTWGVTSTAAVLLIEEGDLDSFENLRELLTEEDEKTRLQAAFVLSHYGKDVTAIEVLEKAYPKASWEHKLHILEAIGMIGSKKSIPFLLQVMEEPFGLLRTTAASSAIQCLYH